MFTYIVCLAVKYLYMVQLAKCICIENILCDSTAISHLLTYVSHIWMIQLWHSPPNLSWFSWEKVCGDILQGEILKKNCQILWMHICIWHIRMYFYCLSQFSHNDIYIKYYSVVTWLAWCLWQVDIKVSEQGLSCNMTWYTCYVPAWQILYHLDELLLTFMASKRNISSLIWNSSKYMHSFQSNLCWYHADSLSFCISIWHKICINDAIRENSPIREGRWISNEITTKQCFYVLIS